MMGFVAGQMRRAVGPTGNLVLNGNKYLSQPLSGRINGPATMLLDFIPMVLPAVTGGVSLRHQLTRVSTDGVASPSLNISPGDTTYNGIGMYRRYSTVVGEQVSLVARSQLVAGQRYKVALTIPSGVTASSHGALFAYVNGAQRHSGSAVSLSRPNEICGTSVASGYSLTGEFVSMAICSAALSPALIAAIAADDDYDLSTLPSLTDLWVGADIAGGVIGNRAGGGPALTLVTKS